MVQRICILILGVKEFNQMTDNLCLLYNFLYVLMHACVCLLYVCVCVCCMYVCLYVVCVAVFGCISLVDLKNEATYQFHWASSSEAGVNLSTKKNKLFSLPSSQNKFFCHLSPLPLSTDITACAHAIVTQVTQGDWRLLFTPFFFTLLSPYSILL